MKTIKLPTGLKVNHVPKNGIIQIQVPEQARTFRSAEVEKHHEDDQIMHYIKRVAADQVASINYFGVN